MFLEFSEATECEQCKNETKRNPFNMTFLIWNSCQNAYAIIDNMYSLLMLSHYQIQRHCLPVSVEMKNSPYNNIKANVIFIKHAFVYNARDRMYWILFHPIIALWYTRITQKWSAKYDQYKCEEMFNQKKIQ